MLGRKAERAALAALAEGARRGAGGGLLVVGEPGIGKTALLDDLVGTTGKSMAVLRATGSESDRAPFAALAALLLPHERHFGTLPPPQAEALRGALGLDEGATRVDLLAVGVATLGVLAEVTRRRPALVVVDDLQWVDAESLSALDLALRRIAALPVAVVLATRTRALHRAAIRTLPTLELTPLRKTDAARLLRSSAPVSLDPAVRRRLLELAEGNPLALVELPHGLSDAQLSGATPLGDPIPVNGGIELSLGARVRLLPDRTRRALLLAAAGEAKSSVLRAEGLKMADFDPAVQDGLVTVAAGNVAFRHPLVRSAVYHGAPEAERRRVHTLLAENEPDPDRRAWHLYAAAEGPDERLAAELDAAATRALARGAPASAANAFTAAARVTGDPEPRGKRLAGAARAAHRAGDVAGARRLSAAAGGLTTDPVVLADLLLVDSDLRMRDGDLEGAHRALVAQAEQLVPIDRRRAATMLLLAAKLRIYRLEAQIAVDEVERALALLPSSEHDVVHLAALSMSRTVAGRPGAREAAFAAAAAAERAPHGHAHTLGVAWPLIWLEEYEAARAAISWAVAIQREAGFLLYLPQGLLSLAELDFRTGEWVTALSAGTEALELFEETAQPSEAASAASVLGRIEAARGNGDACRAFAQRALASDVEFGLRSASAFALAAVGFLALGERRPEDAIEPLEASLRIAALGEVREPWIVLSPPDLVEALVHTRQPGRAAEVLRAFEERLEDVDRPSAKAAAARCAGVLAAAGDWKDAFERALALHETVPTPFERARTELCYGERLRRSRERSEARTMLRSALETFRQLGAAPWVERTRAELRATGEKVPRRSSPIDALTPQERAVATLVAEGLKNQEAAATLFVSEKTIEFHLSNVYRKLGVRSRVALARAMTKTRR